MCVFYQFEEIAFYSYFIIFTKKVCWVLLNAFSVCVCVFVNVVPAHYYINIMNYIDSLSYLV